jgi:MSHA biogenesis protein MshK
MKRLRIRLAVLFAVMLSAMARGEGLTDPTRPPAGFDVTANSAKSADAAPAALVLESVLIHPDSRSAIISGERLTLGQKIRGLRLVRIADTEVVLLDGGERRTLKLYPSAQKKLALPSRPQPGG